MKRAKLSTGVQAILDQSPSQATPLLLELARRQAAKRSAADLMAQWRADGFVAPSVLDQRTLHQLDGFALEAATEFEAAQLSPLAPLGSCSALAPTSQDRTVSAARGLEVVSDPTNVLALACAERLRQRPDSDVRLCTLHQVVRAQALPPQPGFSRHFRLFVLAEAGRGRADDGFETEAIVRHVDVYDRLFDACTALGCIFPERKATVLNTADTETLAQRVCEQLGARFPGIAIERGSLEQRYYDGIRVMFGSRSTAGEHVPIADIGRFDWVAQLTQNRRMRFIASGFGIQLVPLLFAKTPKR